jgi:hypothetical protein
MHDLMIVGGDVRHGDAPSRCCFFFQHTPCRHGDPAQRHEMMPHAARTVSVLVAKARLVAWSLRNLYAGDIRFQLVRNDYRPAGTDSLTHLGAMAEKRHGAVFANRKKDARVILDTAAHRLGAVFCFLRLGRNGKPQGEHKATRGRAEQHAPAADIFEGLHRRHVQTPFAARLIAARMRGYVPHRQMFPLIMESMSASVGFGVSFRSEAACMICPPWQ